MEVDTNVTQITGQTDTVSAQIAEPKFWELMQSYRQIMGVNTVSSRPLVNNSLCSLVTKELPFDAIPQKMLKVAGFY